MIYSILNEYPDYDENVYIMGYNTYINLLKTRKDTDNILDSIVIILENRMKYFGETPELMKKKAHYLWYTKSNKNISIEELNDIYRFYKNLKYRDEKINYLYFLVLTKEYDFKQINIEKYDSTYNSIISISEKYKEKMQKIYINRCIKNKSWLYTRFESGDIEMGNKLIEMNPSLDTMIYINKKMYEFTDNEIYKENLCKIYYNIKNYSECLKYANNNTHDIVGYVYLAQYENFDEFERKLVMVAAYNEFLTCKNYEMLNYCKPYLPTMEDVFIRNMKQGDVYHLGGLINKDIKIITR